MSEHERRQAQFLEGDRRGNLHSSLLEWKAHLDRHQKELEAFLANERALYESRMSEHERRRARAHKAVIISLKAWGDCDKKAFKVQILKAWRRWTQTEGNRARSKQSVHLAVLKFLRGDIRALMSNVTKSWGSYAHHIRLERLRQEDLENQSRHWECFLSEQKRDWRQDVKERQHEAAKAAILRFLEGDSRALLHMCWMHWHRYTEREVVHRVMMQNEESAQSQGEKSAEMIRQLELSLREQERLHDIKVTNDKEKKLAALTSMGLKSSKADMLKYFLVWSAEYQKERQQRLHRMTHNSVLGKFGLYAESRVAKQTSRELLIGCFQEWVRFAHASKLEWHANELASREDMLEDQARMVEELTQERIILSEQLQVVYQQLDAVTDTLQKELRTKEELANELRDANEQMCKVTCSRDKLNASTMSSRATSRTTSPRGNQLNDSVRSHLNDSTSSRFLRRSSSDGSITADKGPRRPWTKRDQATVP